VKAQEDVGFAPLLAFPDLKKDYQSNELFPLFKNGVISPKRTDFQEYIEWLDFHRGHSDPISILPVSGGERVTDNLEVFPKVKADTEGNFHVRFFLHGLRHLGELPIERDAKLKVGEDLRVLIELNNPATRLEVLKPCRQEASGPGYSFHRDACPVFSAWPSSGRIWAFRARRLRSFEAISSKMVWNHLKNPFAMHLTADAKAALMRDHEETPLFATTADRSCLVRESGNPCHQTSESQCAPSGA